MITRLLSRAEQRLGNNGIIVKIWLSLAVARRPQEGSALFSQQFALAPEQFRPDTMGHGDVPFRTAPRRGPRTDQHRQDSLRDRADARSSKRHDRLSAAALGAREL